VLSCIVLYCFVFLFLLLNKTPCRRPLCEELKIPHVVMNFAKFLGAQKLRGLLIWWIMKIWLVVHNTSLMQILHFKRKGTYMDNIEKLYIYKETIKDNQLFSKSRVKTNKINLAIFSSVWLQHIPNRASDISNKKHGNNQL
jgi:hypothetical protein